jgi:hypothetical protein
MNTQSSAEKISKSQLVKGYRGELYNGRDYVGGVYLINGQGYVLNVVDGQVKNVIGIHSPSAFKRAGGMQVSAARSECHWTL